MAFVGTFTNKFDAKGRVSIPAPFRQVLADERSERLYCIPTLEGDAIDAFGAALMAEFERWLEGHSPVMDPDYDAKAQVVFGESYDLQLDDEGRVRLPDPLIQLAGIEERVTLVGLGRKFQIWRPDRFEAVRRARIERALALRRGGGAAS